MLLNFFVVDEWEVSFLASNPITICVIRNLKKIDQRIIGVAVCNPRDKWDSAVGRHKALKNALTNPVVFFGVVDSICFTIYSLPEKAIQKAYWDHYKDVEK